MNVSFNEFWSKERVRMISGLSRKESVEANWRWSVGAVTMERGASHGKPTRKSVLEVSVEEEEKLEKSGRFGMVGGLAREEGSKANPSGNCCCCPICEESPPRQGRTDRRLARNPAPTTAAPSKIALPANVWLAPQLDHSIADSDEEKPLAMHSHPIRYTNT